MKMMRFKKRRLKSVVLATLVLFAATGCNEMAGGITVKENDNVSYNKVAMEKMNIYNGKAALGWLNNDQILDSRLGQYALNTKKAKSLYNDPNSIIESQLSPDKKHLFYNTSRSRDGRDFNYILDLVTKKRSPIITDGMMDPYSVNWIDNQNIIFNDDGGKIYVANINGKVTKINHTQVSNPVKIKDQLFYTENKKLFVWNMKTNQTKVLMDKVEHFTPSPDKKQFAIEKMDNEKQSLVIIDLDGKVKSTVVESKLVGGVGWSPDSNKLAYFSMKSVQASQTELYVADRKSSHSTLLSVNILSFFKGEPVVWSPAGNKLFINGISDGKNETSSTLYVITLKK
jgi:DNA-binding beta-propeller fold protein YncE